MDEVRASGVGGRGDADDRQRDRDRREADHGDGAEGHDHDRDADRPEDGAMKSISYHSSFVAESGRRTRHGPSRRRGMIYLAVLSAGVIVMTLAGGALLAGRSRMRM